jgi:hypothetical protein
MTGPLRIFIGWDARQMPAWNVAARSCSATTTTPLTIQRLAREPLTAQGLYTRPTTTDPHGRLWDVISEAPMATGHAIARFFVPYLCDYDGWALFTDGDVLVRKDVSALFALADPQYAVQVVPHQYTPTAPMKMDGQIQTVYARKNWSSVILWHCGHPANRTLTLDVLNGWPGRDLHRFGWLDDRQIGTLPPEWNWLVGHSSTAVDPAIVHFTDGLPTESGFESVPYADAWHAVARRCGYRFARAVGVAR